LGILWSWGSLSPAATITTTTYQSTATAQIMFIYLFLTLPLFSRLEDKPWHGWQSVDSPNAYYIYA